MSLRKMKIIVAMDSEGGIGKGGTLPWRLKKDMLYFAKVTKAVVDPAKRNAVIMGRKCWESIPETRRPLAGRLNVILSRTLPEKVDKDVIVMNDFESMIKLLSSKPYLDEIETIWNIGGADIYNTALKNGFVDELYITRIEKSFDADVFLNSIDFSKLEKVVVNDENEQNERIGEENGINFEFGRWKVV